ncbi:MAG: MarR family transcriptional regulator [Tistlia sp.]|uniref:MarR family transcriptional regulator n=1 Tax=Tistlia sp. TaxID=3057121 RepID=UPI0034A1A0B8
MEARKALSLWHRVAIESLGHDLAELSQRQTAILLEIYLGEPPHTVRGLAARLGISKPAVTRALHRLEALDYARRRIDEQDRRSVLVQRTVKGSVFLRDFADRIGVLAREAGL